jgi:hypothetical protein
MISKQAELIWEALEFRTPPMLQAVSGLSEARLQWRPPNGANSIAWLLWHIAEVEDNWVREKVYGEAKRYPFGHSVRSAGAAHSSKADLVAYFDDVRALSRARLEGTSDADLVRPVTDEHFGPLTVRGVWSGVITSCAWHGGQLVMLANRFVPK